MAAGLGPRRRSASSEAIGGLLFLAPASLVLLVTSIFPLGYALAVSLVRWRITVPGSHWIWNGLANYGQSLADAGFHSSVRQTVLFVVLSVTLQMVTGLIVALVVAGESSWHRLSRSLLLIPMIMAPVLAGVLWRMLLDASTGLVNWVASLLGFPPQPWLATPGLAFTSVVLIETWKYMPFVMLTLVAGLKSLPPEPAEAARVDGASSLQVFRHITWPMLQPIVYITLLLRVLDAFKAFDSIYVLTGGGPGIVTEFLPFHIYKQGLQFFHVPEAAAQSWIFLLGMIAWSLLVLYLEGRQAVRA